MPTHRIRIDDDGNIVDADGPYVPPTQAEIARDLRRWAVGKAVEIVNNPQRQPVQVDAASASRMVIAIAKDLHAYVMGEKDAHP